MPNQQAVERFLAGALLVILVGSMTIGLWESLYVPQAVTKSLVELIILAAFVACVFTRPESKRALIYLAPLVSIVIIGAITAIAVGDGWSGAALFARDLLKPALLLIIAYSLTQGSSLRVLAVALLLLVAVQIPIAGLKLAFIGIDEKSWIGTMHHSAGQLGVLLPLMAVPPLVVLGLVMGSWIVWLIAFFSFFAIVNEKRLAIFAIPLLALGVWLLAVMQERWLRANDLPVSSVLRRVQTLIAVTVVSAGTVYFGTYAIPSLNPAGKYAGGSFDVRYLWTYVKEYLTRDYVSPMNNPLEKLESDTGIQLGRIELIRRAAADMAEQPLSTVLFGFGGSNTSPSYLLGGDRDDILFKRHKLRGPTPLGVRILFDTGYVGLVILVGWFVWLGVLLLRRMNDKDRSIAILAAIALSWHGVAAVDAFLYSTVLWTSGALAPAYFVLLGCMLMDRVKLSRFLADASRTKSTTRFVSDHAHAE
jgi:hypothetical protein